MSRACDRFEPLLSAWVDGELRRGQRARLAAHLQRCVRCRAEVHALRVTQTMLRSLPTRALPGVAVPGGPAPRRRLHPDVVKRAAVRSSAVAVAVAAVVATAGFLAGSEPEQDIRVAVPVDLYVADHLVRAVGGAVSTPALVDAPSDGGRGRARDEQP